MLNPVFFAELLSCLFPELEDCIDFFVSRVNCQVSDYVSWRPNPFARGGGCIFTGLGTVRMYLLFPSSRFQCNQQSDTEVAAGCSCGYTCGTRQADADLVSVHSPAVDPADASQQHGLARRLSLLACALSGKPSRLTTSRETPQNCLSKGGATERLNSIQVAEKFCTDTGSDIFCPRIAAVVNFLTGLFNTGASYAVVNTARSALSGIISLTNVQPVGEHPRVKRCLRGAFNQRPPLPRYSGTGREDCPRSLAG